MSIRPGLTDATGHAEIIAPAPALTAADVQALIQSQTTTIKEDVVAEITLSLPENVVNSFNGAVGNVFGVSTFNGSTGDVVFAVDGGEY